MKRCCNGDCQQGRTCPAAKNYTWPSWIRWPVLCMRCGSLSHFAEDCTRMPAGLGRSQHERDMAAKVRADRNAVLLAALAFVLALVVISYLERVPS